MLRLIVSATAVMLLSAQPPPDQDRPDDGRIHFPALETGIVDPPGDGAPLTRCSVLDGKHLCDDELGDAWCRSHGFGGGFVDWRLGSPAVKTECAPDDRWCTPVRVITCRGVPIVGD
jgi:hypothetical protein